MGGNYYVRKYQKENHQKKEKGATAAELEASLGSEYAVSHLVRPFFCIQGRSGGRYYCCFGSGGVRIRSCGTDGELSSGRYFD